MAKKSTLTILYLITKSVWGGAAKYVFDLASHLSQDQFRPVVAAGGKDQLYQALKKTDLAYFPLKHFQRKINPLKELLAFFEILILLFRLKPEIIHVNSSKAGGLAGLASWFYNLFKQPKSRVVFTAHGWAFLEDRPKWQISLIKFLSRLTALFYDKIICVSEHDRKTALENNIGSKAKLITIHNGIDFKNLSFFSPDQAREKILNKKADFVVGTIAEYNKNKGLFYLLEATKALRKIDFVLIGSGENPDKKKIETFVQKNHLNNVHLIEWLPQAASYLKAFDVFILTSIKEGLPYTIIEAMAGRLPIIATNVGGIPEMIEDGLNGILIRPKNPQEIKRAILYLINNPEKAKQLGKKAREKAEREFSLKQMIQKTKKTYHC